jgi:hypothetical protein
MYKCQSGKVGGTGVFYMGVRMVGKRPLESQVDMAAK